MGKRGEKLFQTSIYYYVITTANLTIDYKIDDNIIYETIRIIPSKKSYSRFFMLDKYKMGREVDDLLSKHYIGDGENIVFISNQRYRQQYMNKYELRNKDYVPDLRSKKFFIKGEVPKFDGCLFCQHFRPTKQGRDRCVYFKTFLEKHKIYCSAFEERD